MRWPLSFPHHLYPGTRNLTRPQARVCPGLATPVSSSSLGSNRSNSNHVTLVVTYHPNLLKLKQTVTVGTVDKNKPSNATTAYFRTRIGFDRHLYFCPSLPSDNQETYAISCTGCLCPGSSKKVRPSTLSASFFDLYT